MEEKAKSSPFERKSEVITFRCGKGVFDVIAMVAKANDWTIAHTAFHLLMEGINSLDLDQEVSE